MLQNLKDDALINSIKAIAKAKTTQNIIPGQNYIPVTGKVLDEEDILFGVDAALDGWLTAGRFEGAGHCLWFIIANIVLEGF